MDLVVIVIIAVVLAVAAVVGLVFLVLFLAKQFGGSTGGWGRLAETHATPNAPAGQVASGQTLQIGAVVYKRCVTVGVADEGLYLSIWRRTALIPWREFTAIGQATLYWQKVPMLTVGNPAVATIAIPGPIFEALRHRLPAMLAAPPPQANG